MLGRMADVVSSTRQNAMYFSDRRTVDDMKVNPPWHGRAEDAAGPALLRQRS